MIVKIRPFIEVENARLGKPYIISTVGESLSTGWSTLTERIDTAGKRYMDRTYYPLREDIVIILGETVRKQSIPGVYSSYTTYHKALTPEGIVWLASMTILFENEPNTNSEPSPGNTM